MENQTKDSFYRGGSNFEARPNKVRIDPTTNTVKPTHGISIHQDAARVRRFGGAYKILFVPNTLKIVQKGRDPSHHEFVPREANLLTSEQYQEELSKIQAILEE
ncbi:hypothetical protein [[Phormidium] sp. ETS-05]|uniref:hypothetical protein n=1 Tax=[Phormidium] sp. ETS-05 TaxID=222819 RepID=UPI0018EEFA87|nr:hypothetical protein [[Phormidium] sp. ETS-05]